MAIKSFTEYYSRQLKLVFLTLSLLAIAVIVLIIFRTLTNYPVLTVLNTTTVAVISLLIISYLVFKPSVKLCLLVLAYTLLLNLILAFFLVDRTADESLLFLLRDSVFLLLMLVFSGILIHRIHAIIIFLFMVVRYAAMVVEYHPEFLMAHLPIFISIYVAITWLVYYFSGQLHKSIYEIQINHEVIRSHNDELQATMEELKATTEDLAYSNQRLEKMNLSKDKFFTIISHDLKNPLNTLNGFLEILIGKHNTLHKDKQLSYLQHAKGSAESISNLLNDLLEWSRSQSNHINITPSAFSISDLTNSVKFYLAEMANEKGIKLQVEIKTDFKIYADYNMIFTVLRNLVSNAIKFTPGGKEVKILAIEQEKTAQIKVCDEGVGIEPEYIDKLFRIDESFSTPGTNNETGTGMGLILCQDFIHKNQGEIGVESEPGSGSTFWFSLPKA